MPSFLNRVFGYKKQDEEDSTTLLDGKYEAISPSAATFAEAQSAANRDPGFSLFKPKSRSKHALATTVPRLTLQLPPKDEPDSRVVFEPDPESLSLLDDAVIAAKRLHHSEALVLIRACAHTIIERGTHSYRVFSSSSS